MQRKKEQKGHLSVNVPQPIVEALDAEARRLSTELRVPVSRTGVVTRILEEWQSGRDGAPK